MAAKRSLGAASLTILEFEELIITARKRAESLQNTPVSVTALRHDQIDDLEANRIDNIGRYVPNMQFETAGGRVEGTRVGIRGVQNADSGVTRDPAVGIYLDGVYLARAQGTLLATADLNRIEVLRGPQGTLYGRNTIGGAINLISERPQSDRAAEVSVRLGSYDMLETKMMLNVPLIPERLLSRFSFATQSRDGYSKNLFNGERTDDNRLLAGRASFRFLMTDDLIVDLSGDLSKRHQNQRGGKCKYDANQPSNTGLLPNGVVFPSLIPLLVADHNSRSQCEQSGALDDFEYFNAINSELDEKTMGLASTFEWDISDVMSAKWTSSWRRQEDSTDVGFNFTPFEVGLNRTNKPDQADQISSELNLSGTAVDGRLKWTAGAYAFREKVNPGDFMGLVATDLDDLDLANLVPGLPPGQIVGTPALNLLGIDGPLAFSFSEQSATANTNFAGYSQVTFDVTSQLSLTGGVRRLVERKRIKTKRFDLVGDVSNPLVGPLQVSSGNDGLFAGDVFCKQVQGGACIGVPAGQLGPDVVAASGGDPNKIVGFSVSADDSLLLVERSERYDAWTSMLNAQYQIRDGLSLYGGWERGYKSGGFNGRLNPRLPAAADDYQPEELDSFEVGLKSSWFGNRLIVNAALFHSDYDDIQQSQLTIASDGSVAAIVRSAGEATIRGAELEIQSRPWASLELGAGFGFIDAQYEENLRESQLRDPGPDGLLNGFACSLAAPGSPQATACAGDPFAFGSQVRQQVDGSRVLVSGDDITRFYSGNDEPLYNTPDFSMVLWAAYTFDTAWGTVTPRVTWYHQSEVSYSPRTKENEIAANENETQGTYGLLNARVSWALNDGLTEIAFFGSNLLDRRYINDAFPFEDGFSAAALYFGPPRMYGVEIRRSFQGF